MTPKNEEWEAVDEKTASAQHIAAHFAGPGEEKPVETEVDPHDVGKLEYAELTEELLKEYASVHAKVSSLKEIEEMLRRNILKVMGQEERATRGRMAVWVKNETRAGTVDYKRLLKDREITEDILKMYRKPDTEYQKIEVKEIS